MTLDNVWASSMAKDPALPMFRFTSGSTANVYQSVFVDMDFVLEINRGFAAFHECAFQNIHGKLAYTRQSQIWFHECMFHAVKRIELVGGAYAELARCVFWGPLNEAGEMEGTEPVAVVKSGSFVHARQCVIDKYKTAIVVQDQGSEGSVNQSSVRDVDVVLHAMNDANAIVKKSQIQKVPFLKISKNKKGKLCVYDNEAPEGHEFVMDLPSLENKVVLSQLIKTKWSSRCVD